MLMYVRDEDHARLTRLARANHRKISAELGRLIDEELRRLGMVEHCEPDAQINAERK